MERDRLASASYLTIDRGNTRTKVGYFHGNDLLHVASCLPEDLDETVKSIVSKSIDEVPLHVGWISVNQRENISSWPIWRGLKTVVKVKEFSSVDSFPIVNAYKTPETLGIDRLVAVVGATRLITAPPALVIDLGSAITYDILDSSGTYLGGGISPGMNMRFKALATFTARLPLVEPQKKFDLVGNSTHDCIRSGVVNGLLEELRGIIHRYKGQFSEDLSVILAGGDAHFFEKRLKSVNFVEQNLVLWGIRELLSLSI